MQTTKPSHSKIANYAHACRAHNTYSSTRKPPKKEVWGDYRRSHNCDGGTALLERIRAELSILLSLHHRDVHLGPAEYQSPFKLDSGGGLFIVGGEGHITRHGREHCVAASGVVAYLMRHGSGSGARSCTTAGEWLIPELGRRRNYRLQRPVRLGRWRRST